MRQLIRTVALVLGLDPADFGAHSARIGGASDLFAEGCPGPVIQILGRWYRPCLLSFSQPQRGSCHNRNSAPKTLSSSRAAARTRIFLSPASLPLPSYYYLLLSTIPDSPLLSTTIYYYLLLSTIPDSPLLSTIYYP